MAQLRVVLASASPGRLATLRSAGLDPEVVVSGVDEDAVEDAPPAELAQTLAVLKCRAVAGRVDGDGVLVIGCDSVLDLDGVALGKPADRADAVARWRSMRGRSGVLHSGHHLVVRTDGTTREVGATGSTVVHFADLTDEEVETYVATGEPLRVAGAFTIDSLGGPYVRGIEGDPHTVVGISLPLLRELLLEIGIPWHTLRPDPPS